MGYFNSAVVFWSRPEWEALTALPSRIGMRGFRHNDASVWLLDYWTGTRNQPPQYPFQSGNEPKLFSGFDGDTATERLREFRQHLPHVYGEGWLRFAIEVSRKLNTDLYFFAADDDVHDLAASISAGRLIKARLRVELLDVQIDDATFQVTPLFAQDESEVDAHSADIASKLRNLPFVTVGDMRAIDTQLYGNVRALWPLNAGDPEGLFGLGTWDPFLNCDNYLTLEFERLAERERSESATATKKPWWKFW